MRFVLLLENKNIKMEIIIEACKSISGIITAIVVTDLFLILKDYINKGN